VNGPAEVSRRQQQLDATFKRASAFRADPEAAADFARHLCVLVSGYLERSIVELLLDQTRRTSGPRVQHFVESQVERFMNAKCGKILELFGSFSTEWRTDLEGYLVDERKDAVDSVVALRHQIAHGRHVGVTLVQIERYYQVIKTVVEHFERLCA
jgi:hypothetical protein